MKNISVDLNRNFVVTLTSGIILGFTFAYVSLSLSVTSSPKQGYIKLFQRMTSYSNQRMTANTSDDQEGSRRKVRVLCWIMTNPKSHRKKAIHVKRTWGPRCDKIIFTSSALDPELPTVVLKGVKEGRDHLWAKTKAAFKLVYDKYLDEADWFMKADDDTYVIVENLRLMLKQYNPDYPIHFGCKFKIRNNTTIFMSDGAGYVISREALKRFVEMGLPNQENCREGHKGAEDVEMAKCLQNIGVEEGDSRDDLGRHRFFPYELEKHLIPGRLNSRSFFRRYAVNPPTPGMDGCSDLAISFHYVSPKQMYTLDYLIYHLRPELARYNHDKPTPQTVSNTITSITQTISK